MVKAATDIQYGSQFFKEGAELPLEIAKVFELKNPSLLGDRVEINGRWIKITDPRISGFVQEQRHSDGRLVKYFGKEVPEIKKEPESHMLKTHPISKEIPIKSKKKK